MDTILIRPFGLNCRQFSGVTEVLINLSVICILVCSQVWVLATTNDNRVASAIVPKFDMSVTDNFLEELSPNIREKKFDSAVNLKYKNNRIDDVQRGVKHIKITKYFNGRPVRINVVETDLKLANLELKPVLASEKLNSRELISKIAKRSSSVVALNGTYFKPQTGVPLGLLMIDEKLVTGPIYDRVALGVFENGFDVGRVALKAKIYNKHLSVKVDNINQPRTLSTHILVYTPIWGDLAPSSPKYGLQIAVKDGNVSEISENKLTIPDGGYVVVGPKSVLSEFRVGDKVKFDIKTSPNWDNVKHIVSGGPYLVKDGEVYVDMSAQKLNAISGRNPRSAIGYTVDNHLVMVAVDGREGASVGLTLIELAKFMKEIGCVNAINLDGGGSTVMYVNGRVVNNPKNLGGIPISNAVVLSAE